MGAPSFRQFLATTLLLLTLQLFSVDSAQADICFDPQSVDEPVTDDTSKGKSGQKGNNSGNGKGNKSDGEITTQHSCSNPTPSPATPSQPGTPSVTPTNSSNGAYQVSWSAASSMVTSGSNAWGYQLVEYRGGSLVTTYTTSPTVTSYSISGNSDGNYQYKVRGCNLDLNTGVPKCGSYSSLSTTNLVRNKPSTPAKPIVGSTTSTGSVSVSWTKPSGTVSFYQLQRRLNSGSWVTVWNTDIQNPDTTNSSNQLEGTSYTVKNLTDGHWTFRIRACNTYTWACSGFSSISASVKVRLIPGIPSKPIPETLSSITGTYSVSWVEPSGTVTKYHIRELKNGVSYSTNQTSSKAFSYSNRPDGSYTYQVRACNEEDWACSNYGTISSAVNVLHKPGTPSSISGPAGLNKSGSFGISWGAASGQVAYYKTAERHKPIGGTFSAWEYNNRGVILSHQYESLADGEWDFAVSACNASGCSGWRYIDPHVQVLRVPGVPSSIVANNETDSGDYTISWGASTGNSITYQLNERLKPYGSSTYGSWSGPVNSGTERSESFSGRADGEWDYRVRACNDAGCSSYRSISPKVNVLKPPLAPTGVSVDASSDDGSYTLSWNSAVGVVDEYIYSESPSYDDWKFVDKALSTVISGKGDGSWSYKVKACNATSCSPSSLSNTVVVNHPTPPAPASITVPSQVSESTYSINWEASPSIFVDEYQIAQQHEANGWSGWSNVSGTSAEVKVTTAGNWTHRVRACNELPDNTRKCSSSKTSSVVDVQLPANWAWTGGEVEDKTNGHNEGLTTTETVGAIEGQPGVSGGAATYSLPIVIPPGRKGMQPNVSLNYTSRSGNGIAGVGWSLSAGSSIHRCSATYAQDGYTNHKAPIFNSTDKLCIDGKRLIAVSGVYGQSGTQYRTELDTFIRVTQNGDLNVASFTVESKNNHTSYYGVDENSQHIPEGLNSPVSWSIKRKIDASGNNIIYSYQSLANGENLLVAINYTGKNENLGTRKVTFEYELRPDIKREYLQGGVTQSTRRIKSIKTYANSTLIRTYNLEYITSQYTERSLLKSIEECAFDKCLPKTNFSSYHPQIDWEAPVSPTQSLPELNTVDKNDQVKHMDLNGDGLMELLYLSSNYSGTTFTGYSVKIYSRSNVNGEFELKYDTNDDDSPISSGIYYSPKGDLNGDGITDFFIVGEDQKLRLFQFNKYFDALPLIETNVVLPETFITMKSRVMPTLQILDLNGDGYHDFTYIDDDNKIYYHLNKANGETEFKPRLMLDEMQTTVVDYITQREVPTYRDVDGDGVIDIIRTWQNGNTSTVINISFGTVNPMGELVIASTRSSNQLNLPDNNFNNQYLWGDFNGDGLPDFVRATKINGAYDWTILENTGDRYFLTEKSLETGRGIHTDTFFLSNGYGSSRVQALWGGAHAVDIDNDGVDELLVATGSSDNLCVDFSGSEEGLDAEAIQVQACNNDLHKSKATIISGPGAGGEINIDWAEYDVRRFNWSILDFKQTTDSKIILSREISNVVNAPLSSFSIFDGNRSSALQLKDLDNNGYLDFSYNTLSYARTAAAPGQKMNVGGVLYYQAILEVENYSASTGYYEQKNLMGLGSQLGRLADSHYEVVNGLGQRYQWTYSPLSRWLTDRIAGDAFYYVPDDRYIESDPSKQNFYFTSSMYVVSNSQQSNGIGGLNEVQYNYREAIYNRAGRGFQGFRTVIVDDVSRNLRSVSDFHQIFPKAGEIEELKTCLITDQKAECGIGALSKTSVPQYHVQNTAPNIYWVYPAEVIKEQYELNNRELLLNSETTYIGGYICDTANVGCDTDIYGNILSKKTIKDNGFQEVEIIENKSFDYSFANEWWVNKIETSTVKTSTLSPNINVEVAAGSDNDKFISNQYLYDSVGILHRIPTSTVNTASGTTKSHTTAISLNTDGLPTSVTYDGDGSSYSILVRETSTTYSTDGYFPKTVTQKNGGKDLTTTSDISPIHGQPMSVTDANGNVVDYTYDAFGRITSTTVPGGKPIKKGYQWCYSTCPDQRAEYMEFTQQEGSPTVKAYKDMFNRTVMTVTNGFNGVSVYTTKEYDKLGNIKFESIPAKYSASDKGTSYTAYDFIGRLLSKETDRDKGYKYYTNYVHSGHVTSIEVVDGSRTINMTRTYGGDGKLIETSYKNDGIDNYAVTRYAYDSMGNPITLEDAKGNLIHAWHNGFGHKTKVSDPNMGVKTFVYNTFGEVEQEEDANGNILTMYYDALGRLSQRKVNGSELATFTYDREPKGLGLLASESVTGITKEYYYDGHSRPIRQVTTIDNTPYETLTEYDSNFGRVKSLQYPVSGIKVGYDYDDYGYKTKTYNADSGFVYQEVTARDAFLNILNADKNEGTLTESRIYSQTTGQVFTIEVKEGSQQKHFLNYEYTNFGNLYSQTVQYNNGSDYSTEFYSYDDLHRLTYSYREFSNSQTEDPVTYSYDSVGNIESKSDYTSEIKYGLSGKSNSANAGPNAVLSILKNGTLVEDFEYDNNGNMKSGDGKTISYNAFNKPISISKGGISSTFAYGADLMRFKQIKTGIPGGDETTIYLDKMVEITKQGGSTITKTYVDDIAIIRKEEIVGQPLADYKIRFTLRDRLGSVVTLLDHNNNITEHRSYDPFGKPRTGDLMDVVVPTLQEAGLTDPHSGDVMGNIPFTNRGFTDHEHLDDAELIHMNGRAYDYNLGRFLSVDPFIQSPGNSQSMNPYSYIMNNPLAGTDPTGYKFVADSFDCKEINCGAMLSGMGAISLETDNGEEHVMTVTGSREYVDGQAESLIAKGYKRELGRTNEDGTITETFVKPVSGGTSSFMLSPKFIEDLREDAIHKLEVAKEVLLSGDFDDNIYYRKEFEKLFGVTPDDDEYITTFNTVLQRINDTIENLRSADIGMATMENFRKISPTLSSKTLEVLMKNPDTTVEGKPITAFVFKWDRNKNIFLTQYFFDRSSGAMIETLVHEGSHFHTEGSSLKYGTDDGESGIYKNESYRFAGWVRRIYSGPYKHLSN